MIECQVTVRENRHLGDGFYLLNLAAPEIAGQAQPGQFVMLAAGGGYEPLLKRPFGILDAQGDALSLLYEVVGKGTRRISEISAGQKLNLVGPLGNGFPPFSGERILMIAGGRGFAPLFLAARLMAGSNEVVFRYGARSQAQLKLTDWLTHIPLQAVELFTEDGSAGLQGRVGDGLAATMDRHDIRVTLSCGPDAMLKALSAQLQGREGLHYGSFEALMGCGIGICHSCVLPMKDGSYKKVCVDGPVFPMEAVSWAD